ncbi:MAG: hypothetical protein Q8P10_00170 [bacterium]|nr:hypothetical protein [bacterium]
MDDNLLKKGLGGIGNLGKQLGKGIVEETKKTAKGTVSQVTGIEKAGENAEKKDVQPQIKQEQKDQTQASSGQAEDKDFVKMLYGKSENQQVEKPQNPQNPQVQTAQKIAEENPEKTPEEVQKMVQLRQQLHKESYYDPTFNRPKPKEETVQEKLEKEDDEKKMKELEVVKKEEKKKPIAVDQAERKTEAFRGVSG